MPMEQAIALKKAQDTLEASETVRMNYEALCGLWMAYAYGSQWAGLGAGGTGGQNLNQLRTITSANSTDVRFAMNQIGARIVKLDSRLKVKTLTSRAEPATSSVEDYISARVADARLKHHLTNAKGKRMLRRASLWRLVLGSVVVRRCMAQVGKSVQVFDRDGKVSVNPRTGNDRQLRKFRHSWAVCAPYEFIRDPSAMTMDFDDEDIIGHEKPRTVEWLQRKYGTVVKTEVTMGSLLEFHRFLHAATGNAMNGGFSMSKAKGLMFSEWFFKDPEGNDEWDTWMLAYRTTGGPDAEDRKLRVIRFGPNPYAGLPLHHMWYNPKLISPWGQSIPEILMQAQDALNVAYTMSIRAMIMHAMPKWRAEANSLVDKYEHAFSNRTDVPIIYRAGIQHRPDRLPPAPISPEVHNIVNQTSDWFDKLMNMSPVQQGQAVARGEAAAAYQIRRDSADTPITGVIDEDEDTINELLTGTLYDISLTDSLKTLQKDLGGQFTASQIALFKSTDTRKLISGVKVAPNSLAPKTPEEMRTEALDAVNSQMVDAVTARRSLLVRGHIGMDAKEEAAYHKQMAEVKMLLDGEAVEVYLGQDHSMHMYVMSLEQESPQYPSYSPEQRAALQEHWFEHKQMETIIQRLEAEGPAGQLQQQGGAPTVEQEPQGLLPGPGPGAEEGLGGLEQPIGPEAGFAPPADIAGSIGPQPGIASPGVGQAIGFP